MVVDRSFELIDVRQRGGEDTFHRNRIEDAILAAAKECGGFQKYIPPEHALGRNFMLDYRQRNDQEIAHSLTDKVILQFNERITLDVGTIPTHPNPYFKPTIAGVQDKVVHTLYDAGFSEIADAYLGHMSNRNHVRLGTITAEQQPFLGWPSKKAMDDKLRMYEELGCSSVEEVNEMLSKGQPFIDLIHHFCEHYDNQLAKAYETLMERIDNVRMIVIAGKSSSGKTTSTHKFLFERETGKTLIPIHVDNYFKDLQPIDGRGDVNYEIPEALDLVDLKRDLIKIFNGEPVRTPKYDFEASKRIKGKGELVHLKDKDHILVVDSHNGLYPDIQDAVLNATYATANDAENLHKVFSMYLNQWNPQTAKGEMIPHNYNNMLFRVGRDVRTRGTSYAFNFPHFRAVRIGERTHIEPRMNKADVRIDSGMPFFYHFVKRHMYNFPIPDPTSFLKEGKVYGAERCYRVHRLLSAVKAVTEKFMDKSILPDTIVMRECFGGSKYDAK